MSALLLACWASLFILAIFLLCPQTFPECMQLQGKSTCMAAAKAAWLCALVLGLQRKQSNHCTDN